MTKQNGRIIHLVKTRNFGINPSLINILYAINISVINDDLPKLLYMHAKKLHFIPIIWTF